MRLECIKIKMQDVDRHDYSVQSNTERKKKARFVAGDNQKFTMDREAIEIVRKP